MGPHTALVLLTTLVAVLNLAISALSQLMTAGTHYARPDDWTRRYGL
jgi:hypothetical protein